MGLLSISEAREHLREDPDVLDEVLQPYVDGAEAAAAVYLNRALFVDIDAMVAAQNQVATMIGKASAAYGEAMQAAAAESDIEARKAMVDLANERMNLARVSGRRIIHGMVASSDVLAAIKLTLGHLYSNRESVVIGVSAAELPEGVKSILRPHRRIQMP